MHGTMNLKCSNYCVVDGFKQIVHDLSKCRFGYFYRKRPKNFCNFILFFQVIDLIDNAPVFSEELFSAGINLGDKVNTFVTNFSVSMKLQLTLRTQVTCQNNTNKDIFVGQVSRRS
jgi:hypothetical protein